MFLRFFPLDFFAGRFADVAKHYKEHSKSRHSVAWDRATFLKFIGCLIRMACTGYPNMTWHFKWPAKLPADLALPVSLTKYISHAVFKRYWQYFSTPNFNGVESTIAEDGSSDPALLPFTKKLLSTCEEA